jgi:hypothetical protein
MCRMQCETFESELQKSLKEVLYPVREILNSAVGKLFTHGSENF